MDIPENSALSRIGQIAINAQDVDAGALALAHFENGGRGG
jgi:hypothetical protein